MPYPRLRRSFLPKLARRIRLEGLEHVPLQGPYLLAANHQSYLDPPLLAFPVIIHRDHKVWFLTTEHIWKFFGRFGGQRTLRWFGMIPILNSQKADALNPALATLRSGGVIGIFPEGMRNTPKRNVDWQHAMLKGKTGVARLALATGAPVVPVGITAPPGMNTFQAIVNYFRPSQPAVVRFGAPMSFPRRDIATVSRDELDEVTRQVMRAISALCGKSYPY